MNLIIAVIALCCLVGSGQPERYATYSSSYSYHRKSCVTDETGRMRCTEQSSSGTVPPGTSLTTGRGYGGSVGIGSGDRYRISDARGGGDGYGRHSGSDRISSYGWSTGTYGAERGRSEYGVSSGQGVPDGGYGGLDRSSESRRQPAGYGVSYGYGQPSSRVGAAGGRGHVPTDYVRPAESGIRDYGTPGRTTYAGAGDYGTSGRTTYAGASGYGTPGRTTYAGAGTPGQATYAGGYGTPGQATYAGGYGTPGQATYAGGYGTAGQAAHAGADGYGISGQRGYTDSGSYGSPGQGAYRGTGTSSQVSYGGADSYGAAAGHAASGSQISPTGYSIDERRTQPSPYHSSAVSHGTGSQSPSWDSGISDSSVRQLSPWDDPTRTPTVDLSSSRDIAAAVTEAPPSLDDLDSAEGGESNGSDSGTEVKLITDDERNGIGNGATTRHIQRRQRNSDTAGQDRLYGKETSARKYRATGSAADLRSNYEQTSY